MLKRKAMAARPRAPSGARASAARCIAVSSFLLALLGESGRGAAEPPPATTQRIPLSLIPQRMRLEVARAPGVDTCPDADFFTNRVTVELGGHPGPFADGARARLLVTLEPEPDGQRHRGRFELFAEDGALIMRRELEEMHDCDVLVSILALSFVVHWQALRSREAVPPPQPKPKPPPTPSPPVAPVVPTASARRPPPTPSPVGSRVCKFWIGDYCVPVDIYSVGLSTGIMMTAGFTDDVGPAAWVGGEIRLVERFSIELQFRGIFPGPITLTEPLDPSQPFVSPHPLKPDLSNLVVMLVPCFRYSYFMGCVVGQFGFSVYQTPIDQALGLSAGAGPRLGIEIPFLERFAVRAFGDLIIQYPTGFSSRNVNLKYDVSPIMGMVGAGLAVNFK